MADTTAILLGRLAAAFDQIELGADPVLRPSDRCDYQVNGTLALAKRRGQNPRELAEQIVALADLDDLVSSAEVAGPGFINLTLDQGFLERQLSALVGDARLGIATEPPRRIVVDYSSPNVAKEMHVGHLRGTIIGDSLVRLLGFCGHEVVRENHIGDWGTPFGMLIEHLVDVGEAGAIEALSVGDLDSFYKAARQSFDADPAFQDRARARVVLLQGGDAETLRLWRVLVAESVRYFDTVYRHLDVLLDDGDLRGESVYNDDLHQVVADLDQLGLLEVSDGASCVFPPGFTNREGEPLPLIVRKSDEGYGYAATDLACIRDRVGRVGATELLYVVGADQSQHLEMCFEVARMAGWLTPPAAAIHVGFGNILGEDKRKFKTRSGTTVKLVELLNEAVERAMTALRARNPEAAEDELRPRAHQLGIGAVKYADLSTERMKDYVFDFDRMLAAEGNTGPYLMYAHARICSIFRRADDLGTAPSAPRLLEPAERALGLALLGFPDAIAAAVEGYLPSKLCSYLFDLAQSFSSFYEACPVLRAEPEVAASRLGLCALTRDTVFLGLQLLGIDAPSQM